MQKSISQKIIISGLFIIFFFIISSYFVQQNLAAIKSLISPSLFSAIIYVIILALAVVVAPLNAMPLIPLASAVFGWMTTGILSILGWAIGAVIAFLIARNYGSPFIVHTKIVKTINRFETELSTPKQLILITLLRMTLPIDILSYALGLFSRISLPHYILTTIIGISPFAFVFAYTGTLLIFQQIIIFAVIAILIALILWLILGRKNKK